jgi:4-hydroxy-tetrahydrodipicolinate synthase
VGRLDDLKGCGTVMVTPFKPDGSLDEKTLAALAEWQIQEGIHFLVPCGTTGESATLAHDEYLSVVDITVKTARGRVPVVAGAGGNNTARVIELIHELEKLGVDGILSASAWDTFGTIPSMPTFATTMNYYRGREIFVSSCAGSAFD